MATVQYTSLYPTSDPVTYDSTNVDYPDANVVDTFGTIWVSKVHGFDMNVLELASAGKLAFTPSNEHSMDLKLSETGEDVVLKARDAKNFVLENETKSADFTLFESGRTELRSESSVFRMDSNVNLLDAGVDGSNLFVASSNRSHAFHVGGDEILNVDSTGASVSNLYVNGTEFRVPFGDDVARPVGTEGLIFYNTSASRFEGYSSGAWSGLGGVVDVDQDTYISAETAPGDDNDELIFVTSNVERLRVKSDGRVGYGTTSPEHDLDWRGDARLITSESNAVTLDSSGLTVDVGGAQISRTTASGMSVSNLVVNGTDMRVPVGDVLARPSGTNGQVFYNTSANRFEGYSSGAWSGLGGVVDVDQDTYISAETAPGTDNDELKFVTGGVEHMRLDSQGFLGFGMSNPEYTIDVIGNLRVSGNLIAASTTIGAAEDGGRVMKLGVQSDGSDAVIDGIDTNDGAGFEVAGAPSAAALSGSRISRFEKSFKWRYGAEGMQSLAQKDAWETESYWKLSGGAFRMGVVNSDSGSETEMIFRINERDELQLVKHTIPADGTAETYDVIAKFGKGGVEGLASTRGFVAIDADRTSMDTAAGTVEAYIESFSAYSDYKVYGALFLVSETPTSSEVKAAAEANGFVSGTLAAATDSTSLANLSAMADGSAIPDAIVKFVGVSENASTLAISSPFVSFVLNNASVYDTLSTQLEEEAQTETAINVEYTFDSLVWDDLSPADQEIFREWMEDQLIQGAAEKGITITSVDLQIVSGSIKVTSALQVSTNDVTKVLKNTLAATETTSLMKSPTTTPINFQDRAVEKITKESVALQVKEVTRIQSLPSVNKVAEVASSGSSMTFSYDVSEANPELAVSKLYVLVSPVALSANTIPSKIVSNPNTQVFDVASTAGQVDIATDPKVRNFVYFVSENNATSKVRSNIKRFITDPLTINASSLVPGAGGSGRLVKQSLSEYSVTSYSSVSVFSPASSGTAYMLLYPEGSVPATDADIHADVLGGSTYSVAALA